MHRKYVRATVDGVDIDVPISTFGALQYLYYNGEHITTAELPELIVSGVPPTLDNAIARWDGTTGTILQNSLVIISDTAQVTGVTALNGRDIARWTDGPAIGGATDSAVALWDGTTGRLLKNSVVTINDDGDITTPGDMNPTSIGTIPVGVLVRSSEPTTHVDNSVARWDGTTGNSLDDSLVVIDDSGNVTGVTTLNTRDVSLWVDGPTPAVSVHGNITVWDGTTGRLIADSGLNVANLVYNLDSEVVTGHLPEFTDSAGRRITDSGIISDHVVTSAAVGVDNRIARYDGSLRAIQSSAVSIDDSGAVSGVLMLNGTDPSLWVRGPASSVSGNLAAFNGSSGKAIYDTGTTIPSGGWVTGPSSATHNVIACFNGTTGKAIYTGGPTVTLSGTSIANVTSLSGRVVANLVSGPGVAVVAGNLLSWNGTGGAAALDSGIGGFSVARNAGGFANDNRLVRTDTVLHASGVQPSGIVVSDSDNITGVNDLSINGTLNSRDPDTFVAGPAGATDNRIARFDGTTGYLIQNSAVTIDDSGNITGVGTVNGNAIGTALGIASATDNRVVRFDGTGGKQLQQSAVTIDDSGNMSGIGTITSGNVNGVNVASHASRHQPSGADSMFSGSSSDWLQMVPEWRSSGGGSWLRRLMRAFLTSGGGSTGSYVSVLTNTTVCVTSGATACAVALIPYSLTDTGLNVTVYSSWANCSTAAQVSCGNSGGRIASSGGTVVFGSSTPNGIPAVGLICVVWPVTGTGVAQVALAVAISGSGGTVHPGCFMSFSNDSDNA